MPYKVSSVKALSESCGSRWLGIKVVRPDLGTSTIVGVSCAILVLLFMAQPLGIARLASGFAPVVVIWLLLNLIYGIYVCRHRALTYDQHTDNQAEPCYA